MGLLLLRTDRGHSSHGPSHLPDLQLSRWGRARRLLRLGVPTSLCAWTRVEPWNPQGQGGKFWVGQLILEPPPLTQSLEASRSTSSALTLRRVLRFRSSLTTMSKSMFNSSTKQAATVASLLCAACMTSTRLVTNHSEFSPRFNLRLNAREISTACLASHLSVYGLLSQVTPKRVPNDGLAAS